jgi:colanic acid biosynthesis glycosyl transferase WcaI
MRVDGLAIMTSEMDLSTGASEAVPTRAPLHVQLWSYNYDPEPTGIGVVSKTLAHGLRDRGHEVEVVAAHPHYPEPLWGRRLVPYRELRDGIPVLRLPLWVGRASAAERYRQELTFLASQSAATPFLRRPDVLVSASPSFPALLPAVVNVRARRVPWVLWLHDLLPDGAAATGLVDDGSRIIALARRLELAAYHAAARIVVLSHAFVENLAAKGVSREKIDLIYDPATRVPASLANPSSNERLQILSMGNIGHSQGLTGVVSAFERRPELEVDLIITGTGVAAAEARAMIRTDRVQMPGLVDDASLERYLQGTDIALVTQNHTGSEFNIPSKLMNFMAYGLPVLAVVNPSSEVAKIVTESRGGWVVDSEDPDSFPALLAQLKGDSAQITARATAALSYASARYTQLGFAERFETILRLSMRSDSRVGRS